MTPPFAISHYPFRTRQGALSYSVIGPARVRALVVASSSGILDAPLYNPAVPDAFRPEIRQNTTWHIRLMRAFVRDKNVKIAELKKESILPNVLVVCRRKVIGRRDLRYEMGAYLKANRESPIKQGEEGFYGSKGLP